MIGDFITQVLAQDYPGPIDLVLVDDCSPEYDATIARAAAASLSSAGREDRSVTVIAREDYAGNCASLLAGLTTVEADVYVVTNCDCLMNTGFVAAHVFEHARPDVDVVIGPLNIETNGRDPIDLLRSLENSHERVAAESGLQDPVQADGFLNCITRNLSIKRRQLDEELLSGLDLSYSARRGFGWEDVEMGYRLYRRGAVIRFTRLAFSVHVSHPSSISDALRVEGSINNFERMFAKYPEMRDVARRWATVTFDRIARWAAQEGVEGGASMASLRERFDTPLKEAAPLIGVYGGSTRRLRILSYRWHVPHQYELYKLPHDFTLVTNVGENGMINNWGYEQRPPRPNVRFTPFASIDPRGYDLVVLHFDENVLYPNLCNHVIPSSWGDPFFALLALDELPKVAICHGTPQFRGQYGLNPKRIDRFVVHDPERQALVDLLTHHDVKVVCNSHQALAEWGFADARVIWHGFDPQQFPPGSQTRDILALAPDLHRPHYRGTWEHRMVYDALDPNLKIETAAHDSAAIDPRRTEAFATRNFHSYVDRIRQFTVYLNTTLRSPMPRSRGEAMMTGVIPVCLRNHDVDRFIEPGRNGFYSDNPVELAVWINDLFRDEPRRRAMAAAARRTAIDVFNHDRYLNAWQQLMEERLSD